MSEAKMKEAEELIRKGGQEDVARGLELLDQVQSGTEDAVEETVDESILQELSVEPNQESPELTAEERAEQEAVLSSLKIKYRDQEFELPDEDGFLGRKDLEGLKKAAAHKEAHIRYVEEQERLAREKIAELQEKLKTTLVQKEVMQPVKGEPSEKVITRPKKPARPAVGADPAYWTPEEEQQMAEYGSLQDQYDTNMDSYFDYLENRVPEDPRFAKYDSLMAEQEKSTAAKQAQLEEAAYWSNIEEFRITHPEYKKYRGNIKDLHKEVDTWTTRLANAAGHSLPLSPTAAEISQFEATKQQLAYKFETGEQAVIELNVAPPEGYKEYYALADLEAKKEALIKQEVLAPKANLHNAWIQIQDSSGTLEDGINSLEVEARKRGFNSAINVMEKQQANIATPIPNSANQQAPVSGVKGLSSAQIREILNTSTTDLMMNPERKALFDEIVSSGKFS